MTAIHFVAVAAFFASKYSSQHLNTQRDPLNGDSRYCSFSRPISCILLSTNRSDGITLKLAQGDDNDDDKGNESSSVAEQVKAARNVRQAGILLGGIFLMTASALGTVVDIIDPALLLALTAAAFLYFGVNTLLYNESEDPMPDSAFEVGESMIPNGGNGLFATMPIPANTYLFDYLGEFLSEEEYFARYPDGQGRYVAVIDEQISLPGFGNLGEPTYIDGIDPAKSNLARYMNSKLSGEGENSANIFWRKQRYGNQAGCMHFYTIRNVEAGEELCFNYGDNYWDAVVDANDETYRI